MIDLQQILSRWSVNLVDDEEDIVHIRKRPEEWGVCGLAPYLALLEAEEKL